MQEYFEIETENGVERVDLSIDTKSKVVCIAVDGGPGCPLIGTRLTPDQAMQLALKLMGFSSFLQRNGGELA